MNFNGQIGILIAFALYMAVMIGIGIYYSRRQKSLSQYILGDRNLGPWLTSLGAEASDMSGWMLMGLPGYAYLHGLSAFWTASGLILGTWLNWVLTAKRLRTYTEIADNSLTIPDYLSNRFKDKVLPHVGYYEIGKLEFINVGNNLVTGISTTPTKEELIKKYGKDYPWLKNLNIEE